MKTGCTQKKIRFAQSGYLLIGALLYGHTVYATEQVAIVIAAEGKATANARALARRGAIYQGETVNTAAGGKVAFKFTDGSVVTLKENSSYVIKNYSFNKSQKPDNFDAHLIKGGLKTVTGKIGKEAQHTQDAIEAGIPVSQQVKVSNYKVKAAIATIGVRGTSYKCVIKESSDKCLAGKCIQHDDNDKLLLSATSGGITAEYNDESMDLGVGSVAAYAQIESDGTAGYLSSDPIPDADFDIASGDDEDDEGGDEGDDDDDDDDDDDEGGDDEGGDDSDGDDAAGDDSGSESE